MAVLGRSAEAPLSAGIRGERPVALVAAALSALVAAAVGAAALGAPGAVFAFAFTFAMPVLPALGWWAFARAPDDLRRFWGFVAAGVTLWLAGSALWYASYVGAGYSEPHSPGVWDVVFLAAYGLVLAGVFFGIRDALPLRDALLDASVAAAAGLAVGAAVIAHELAGGVSLESVATLVRPLFGIAVVTLVVSAALGAWHGLWLSVALFGAGQVSFTAGSLAYGYGVEPGHLADRWADLAWLVGTAVSMLAAALVVLRADRPIRRGGSPGVLRGPAAAPVLLLALAALGVAVSVVWYGHRTGVRPVLVVGLAAAVWIGAAMALRARNAIRALEAAYADLDRAHLTLERTNDELARANAEVRAVHGAFEDLLVLADTRTDGALRELVESAGEDVAAMLEDYRARDRPTDGD